jgi:hypothetical protein
MAAIIEEAAIAADNAIAIVATTTSAMTMADEMPSVMRLTGFLSSAVLEHKF